MNFFEIQGKEQDPKLTDICSYYIGFAASSFQVQADSKSSSRFYVSVEPSVTSLVDQATYSSQRLGEALVVAILKASMSPADFQRLCEKVHLAEYGVSENYLKNSLYEKSFEDLEQWIINNKNLNREQSLRIWNSYCNEKWFRRKKKSDGYVQIEQEHLKRADLKNKEELAKQIAQKQSAQDKNFKEQEQKAREAELELQRTERARVGEEVRLEKERVENRLAFQQEACKKRMKLHGFDPEQSNYLLHDFQQIQQEYDYCLEICNENKESMSLENWQSRSDAVQKTIAQSYKQSWQEIILSPQAEGYLRACNLESGFYRSCYGTAFQQQLHKEVCDTFEFIAAEQSKAACNILFLDLATQCNDASFWSNDFEAVHLAIGLQDLAQACCGAGKWVVDQAPRYLKAMGEGAIESAHEFVHMVSHPVDTIGNIGQAAYFVMETISLHHPELLLEYPEIMEPLRDKRREVISSITSSCWNHICDADGPERAKMVSRLASDCIFQHKAMQAFGAVAGIIRSQAGAMRTMEYVADFMGHEPEFLLAGEQITNATQELETVLQRGVAEEVAELSKGLETSGLAAIATRPLAEIVSEITTKFGGKIPLSNTALCEEVKAVVKKLIKETNVVIDEKFKNMSSWKMIQDGGVKRRVNLDLEHIINYSIEFGDDALNDALKMTFKGGHLAGNAEALSIRGVARITNKTILSNGCIEYKLQNLLTNKPFTKTEFPAHWDYKKVVRSCWDIYENPKNIEFKVNGGKFAKEGLVDGLEMTVIFKRHKKSINVVTALPGIGVEKIL